MYTGFLLAAQGGASSRSGHYWDERDVCGLQSAAWLQFLKSPCVQVSLDAKRLGNPAEDTLAYLALDAQSRRAMWLAPQVARL